MSSFGSEVTHLSELVGHTFLLLVALPFSVFIPSLVLGGIMAGIEGWSFVDGFLYVGGDLVFYVLTSVAPTTTAGRVLDFFVSCTALGIFSWLMALIGALPFVDHTNSWITAKSGGSKIGGVVLFFSILSPVVNILVSFALALPLSFMEGWSFKDAALYAEGLMVHCPSLAPASAAPKTTDGKIMVLLIAVYGLAVAVGWAVGVMLNIPALNDMANYPQKLFPYKGVKLSAFVLFILIGLPILISPVVFIGGGILAWLEEWPADDAFVYVGGNLVLIPLSSLAPTTFNGQLFDFFISCFGIGVFAFVIAAVGAMPFVDHAAELMGGKVPGPAAVYFFAFKFFFIVMPLISAGVAVILGACIMSAEAWTFKDSFLYVVGILLQSPSIAPASTVPTTTAGKMIIILIATYSVSIPIGFGAGVIVASHGLDFASGKLRDWLPHSFPFLHLAELTGYSDEEDDDEEDDEEKKNGKLATAY
mmetsp:Transcript_82794/g.146269  ORF Transcript_82794/g.146269 Transcript_82794/m.146269 type:complete len:476 (+) Transcript_82794:54-1481(+)